MFCRHLQRHSGSAGKVPFGERKRQELEKGWKTEGVQVAGRRGWRVALSGGGAINSEGKSDRGAEWNNGRTDLMVRRPLVKLVRNEGMEATAVDAEDGCAARQLCVSCVGLAAARPGLTEGMVLGRLHLRECSAMRDGGIIAHMANKCSYPQISSQ